MARATSRRRKGKSAPVDAPPPPPTIRDSTEADMASVQAIYAHHVRHGLASFEEDEPDVEEMMRRRAALREIDMPHLVAEAYDGAILGFAYAGPYRPRPAYRFAVEDSVYVDPHAARRGAGRALLGALIERCAALGYRQMVAVIGDSANRPSIGLHEALGFDRAGLLPSVGFKLGRWVDIVILQRSLGEGDETLP